MSMDGRVLNVDQVDCAQCADSGTEDTEELGCGGRSDLVCEIMCVHGLRYL